MTLTRSTMGVSGYVILPKTQTARRKRVIAPRTWCVIQVDNFDRESISDRLVEDHLTFQEAHDLAREKNVESPPDGPWFYRAVSNYRMHRLEP